MYNYKPSERYLQMRASLQQKEEKIAQRSGMRSAILNVGAGVLKSGLAQKKKSYLKLAKRLESIAKDLEWTTEEKIHESDINSLKAKFTQ